MLSMFEFVTNYDSPSKLVGTSEGEVRLVFAPVDVSDEAKFLDELKFILNLPDYYGSNWNALDECLRDPDWMDNRTILICHSHLPHLSRQGCKIYLDVLSDAISYWRAERQGELRGVFLVEDIPYIKGLENETGD